MIKFRYLRYDKVRYVVGYGLRRDGMVCLALHVV